jgi:hypothetical protein
MIRRVAACLLFAAIVAGGVRASMLRLLLPPHRPPNVPNNIAGIDRAPLRLKTDPTPPELLQFLNTIREQTREGERIGVIFGWPHAGFSYTYWRARYILAGRTVLLPMDIVAPEEAPDVVAVWDTGWGDPRFEIVWLGSHGAIERKKK